MPKLYEITKDYIAMQNEDMEPEQLADCLESIQGAIEEKGGNIVSLIQNWQGGVDAIDVQIKRLQAMKKATVSRQDKLKEYLRYNMVESGVTKIEHPLFKISIRKPTQKVEIVDLDLIPDEFIKVEVTEKPDLMAIKKQLKLGDVAGVRLVDGTPSLTIK